MSSKQDGSYPRTAASLEQKYQFGKSFAEIMGIATDARDKAENANTSVGDLDKKLDHQEIFNRLTDNGNIHGLFRGEDGELYINAEYIVAIEALFKNLSVWEQLFANNINMTGKFTCRSEAYLTPDETEITAIQQHIIGTTTIPAERLPLYDYDGDGTLSGVDIAAFSKMRLGLLNMADWSKAVKSTVIMTIDLANPEKTITISGTNMWGRYIERYIGINNSNLRLEGHADYVVEQGTEGFWTYEKWASGKAVCWGNTWEATYSITEAYGNAYICGAYIEFPSGLFANTPAVNVAFTSTQGSYGCAHASVSQLWQASFNVNIVDNVSSTRTGFLCIQAFGRWK